MNIKRACVIGWPVSHSRSPLIHGYWLGKYGILGSYDRHAVPPGAVKEFIDSLADEGYLGCNVTLPHKETVFDLVNIADEPTRRLGVVNTVFSRNGELWGTSTDGEGFLASVEATVSDWRVSGRNVMLLGAGGAARAIAGTMVARGAAQIQVVNRTLERAETLRTDFGKRITPLAWEAAPGALAEVDLLVNTSSLGMTGQPPLQLDLTKLPGAAIVSDIVYVPLETAFLRAARERGNRTVGGLGMLLHQAVRGFELWFGTKPEVTQDLHDFIAESIERGYRTT
jgi:shikimate dehydrogenase